MGRKNYGFNDFMRDFDEPDMFEDHYRDWNDKFGNNFTDNNGIHNKMMSEKNIETQGGYQATVSGMYGEFTIASIFKSLPDEYAVLNDILIQTGTKLRRYTQADLNKYGVTPWQLVMKFGKKKIKPVNKDAALRNLASNPNAVYYEVVKKSSQIDHLIVSPYGIFIIETKNHKGYIFGNDIDSKVWTQVLKGEKGLGAYGGRSHFTFLNPIIQNNLHIEHLAKATGIPYNCMEGFVVFTNPDAYLGNVLSERCFTLDMLYERILSYTNMIWDIKQRDKVIRLIEKMNSSSYSLSNEHVTYVKDLQHRREVNKYFVNCR